MHRYHAAQAALFASIGFMFLSSTASAAASSTASTGTVDSSTFESLIPQLGVFTIVIVVFKFMLGRQDERDEKAEERDSDVITQLRTDIISLRNELAEERKAHNDTRQKLMDYIIKAHVQ